MADVTGRGMFPPSNINGNFHFNPFEQVQNDFMHSMMVDEGFLMVAAHVSEVLRRRIEQGEYIDFTRLIPRDRVTHEEDNRLVPVHENITK